MLNSRSMQSGFSIIEAMVTLVILTVGLLGLAGLQARAMSSEIESYARGQAILLVDDMADRILSNPVAAKNGEFPGTGSGFTAEAATTCPVGGAAQELCEWAKAIKGNAVKQGTATIGTLNNPVGCVTWGAATRTYQVSVAWASGQSVSGAQPNNCGSDRIPGAFRTVVVRSVRLATLN